MQNTRAHLIQMPGPFFSPAQHIADAGIYVPTSSYPTCIHTSAFVHILFYNHKARALSHVTKSYKV